MSKQVNNKETIKRIPIIKSKAKAMPSTQEVITVEHVLRILNHAEIIAVLELYKVKIPQSVLKHSELVQFVIHQFSNGLFDEGLFEELRDRAFNPEVNATDGFYLSYKHRSNNVVKETAQKCVKEWNRNSEGAKIEIGKYGNGRCQFLVSKFHDKYAYDIESMYSIKYQDVSRVSVEVDIVKQIVFFQTSNSVKFKAVKPVIQDFLQFMLNSQPYETITLLPPKMSQNLSLSLQENGNTAIVHDNVNSNTIKLLDLLFELDDSSKFSGFKCIDITFDHEDKQKKNMPSRIDTQAFGGGNLLYKDEVKKLILSKRVVLQINFRIEYREQKADESEKIHIIMAGIDNNRSGSFRIYIRNNDLDLRQVIKKAYNDLKEVFYEHLTASNLRNEDKIKSLLGF